MWQQAPVVMWYSETGPIGIHMLLVFVYIFICNAYFKIYKSTIAHEKGMREGCTTYSNMYFNEPKLLSVLTSVWSTLYIII